MIAINEDACTGCGYCAKVCPQAVIEMRDQKAFLVAEDRCMECSACQLNCHDGAIEVSQGTGCLFIIVRDDILKLGDGSKTCGC